LASSLVDKSQLLTKGARILERESSGLTRFCSQLVRFPTENPPAIATEITAFIRDWLEDSGISSRVYCRVKGKENMVSNLERKAGPGLIFYGHTDVVPAGDVKRWSYPPYSGKITGGRVFGRGASDMKGGLAASLFAFKVMAQLDVKLRRNLQLTVIPDEEDYDPKKRLLDKLIEDGAIAGDGCIMGEPTGQDGMSVGDKGDLWLKVRATGTPAHGSSPVLGDNAFLRLSKALAALAEFWNDEPPIPTDVREVLPFSEELVTRMIIALGFPERVEDAKMLLTHTSVNIGRVNAGTMINMVPDKAEAEVALCLAPGLKATEALERVKDLLKGCIGIEVENMMEFDSNFTSPKLPFVKLLGEAGRSVMGNEVKPFLFTGTSDAGAFRVKGIPAVCFGPGDIARVHNYNEYVDVKDLTAFAKAYLRTAIEYCT